MKPKDRINLSKDHSIEWGESSWDNGSDFSIRNRFDNNSNGGFNIRGSSELPWHDFNTMILESIKRNHFTESDITNILIEIAKNRIK